MSCHGQYILHGAGACEGVWTNVCKRLPSMAANLILPRIHVKEVCLVGICGVVRGVPQQCRENVVQRVEAAGCFKLIAKPSPVVELLRQFIHEDLGPGSSAGAQDGQQHDCTHGNERRMLQRLHAPWSEAD